jgi:hypothetical protein
MEADDEGATDVLREPDSQVAVQLGEERAEHPDEREVDGARGLVTQEVGDGQGSEHVAGVARRPAQLRELVVPTSR